jgi:kynurenine formamidase
MPVYPGTMAPLVSMASSLEQDGFRESLLTFVTHTGTHLDAPAHIYTDGKTVDAFSCEKYYGFTKVVDCRNLSEISVAHIEKVLAEPNLPDFLLFCTDWSQYWGKPQYFDGFPVLTTEAAKLLASLPFKGLGIDAISFDSVGSTSLSNHLILLAEDFILIENLRNLAQLINTDFYLSCFPLKIKDGDGSPVRACAIIS